MDLVWLYGIFRYAVFICNVLIFIENNKLIPDPGNNVIRNKILFWHEYIKMVAIVSRIQCATSWQPYALNIFVFTIFTLY